jgi:hypothetical protein
MNFKSAVRQGAAKLGYKIERLKPSFEPVMEQEFREIAGLCKVENGQSTERLYGLYKALEYISKHQIQGDLVECGVFKGLSPMMMAHFLKNRSDFSRKIYLYDTFEGMTAATSADVDMLSGKTAKEEVADVKGRDWNTWCCGTLEEVQKNVWETGYPKDKLIFVKGKVEETIPQVIPEQISLLRLDTDWYESTAHELQYLFPRLVRGGILILDDYGHWQGAKKAADEYFAKTGTPILLTRIDYAGRLAVKL